jgi:hypothetical protein
MINKNKRTISQLKAYFLIANMILAMIAFSYIVSAPTVYSKSSIPNNAINVKDTPKGITYDLPAKTSSTGAGPASAAMALNEAGKKTAVEGATAKGPLEAMGSFFGKNMMSNLMQAGMIGALGAMIGGFAGGKNGAMWGFVSGFAGSITYQIAADYAVKNGITGLFGQSWLTPGVLGIGVAVIIFVLTYKKASTEIVEFNCLPWQAPIGGANCEKCNSALEACSEYRCKSLGQACELLNKGTKNEACTWVNPRDVNSPMIKVENVIKGYKYVPDTAIRPPATGVVISQENGNCVKAFTPLEFTISTDEPAQCKVDYNLSTGFNEMTYYVGGDSLFSYNHTEKMSLPGPDAINAVAPELKNDGTYTLYVRCQDANGNFNQDAFSVRFCVDKGPDTTAPIIVSESIPSNSPILFNKSSINLEVYVNEPSECKWSRQDRTYDNMENSMSCSKNIWDMNSNMVYTCKTTLTGIESRKENDYYFRCKDQPGAEESKRNVNVQSFLYKIIGTQPLNILESGPNETISGATNSIPVYLTIKTDNGYNNGESTCYYSTTGNEKDYIQFLTNEGITHTQRQDLTSGNYKYYFKCVDLGGNTAYNATSFRVESDNSAPIVVRIYNDNAQLKIITSEKSDCSYSNKDCNFEIKDGISMPYANDVLHTAEWKVNKNYYIRCADSYNNQPNPNTCSIIVRPYELVSKQSNSNVIVL